MIAHARHNELGGYEGGKLGDQDGSEVAITNWYNRPWNVILRCKDYDKRELIADAAEKCANNNMIGYNQLKRTGLYASAKLRDWQIEKIDTPCDTDCSAMVSVCVNAAGISVSKDIYTGNERKALLNTGMFEALTDSKYLTSDKYLLRGDILLYEGHHTAVNLKRNKYVPGWHKDEVGWWYAKNETDYAKSEWMAINKCMYYFNDKGYAVTGEQIIDGERYYFEPTPGAAKECALLVTNKDNALELFVLT